MTNMDSAPAAKTTGPHLTLLGGLARRGHWEMRRRTIAISPVGGADLDLTEAALPDGEATVIKVSLVGGVKLTVPQGVNVAIEGFNLIFRGHPGRAGARSRGVPHGRTRSPGRSAGASCPRRGRPWR